VNIDWGKGSAFNLGRIKNSNIRVERVKDQNMKWYFLLSDEQYTYLHCDGGRYDTLQEMESAVFEWIASEYERGRN
jgi:hypothetical protein